MLIIREALLGVHRFDEMQADLGIARNVLQARLEHLVAHGILERRLYHSRPDRYAYHLTQKGLDLWPAVVALMQWGDKHADVPGGPPVRLEHRGCGGSRGRPPPVRDLWREARAARRVGPPGWRTCRPTIRCAGAPRRDRQALDGGASVLRRGRPARGRGRARGRSCVTSAPAMRTGSPKK